MSKTSRRSFLSLLGLAAASPVLAKVAVETADPKRQTYLDAVEKLALGEPPIMILPGRVTYVLHTPMPPAQWRRFN